MEPVTIRLTFEEVSRLFLFMSLQRSLQKEKPPSHHNCNYIRLIVQNDNGIGTSLEAQYKENTQDITEYGSW